MNGTSKTRRKDDISCVQLSKDTKEKLDELGTNRKDTYESIILSLMDSSCVQKPEVEEDEL